MVESTRWQYLTSLAPGWGHAGLASCSAFPACRQDVVTVAEIGVAQFGDRRRLERIGCRCEIHFVFQNPGRAIDSKFNLKFKWIALDEPQFLHRSQSGVTMCHISKIIMSRWQNLRLSISGLYFSHRPRFIDIVRQMLRNHLITSILLCTIDAEQFV